MATEVKPNLLTTIQEINIEEIKPDQAVTFLKALKVEIQKANGQKEQQELLQLANFIRIMVRATSGLSLEEQVFFGLIDVNQLKERTRLTEHDVYGHSLMKLLFKHGGEEMKIWEDIANEEDGYFISEEGLGRMEGVNLAMAKQRNDNFNVTLNQPEQQPNVPEENEKVNIPHKKKSKWKFW